MTDFEQHGRWCADDGDFSISLNGWRIPMVQKKTSDLDDLASNWTKYREWKPFFTNQAWGCFLVHANLWPNLPVKIHGWPMQKRPFMAMNRIPNSRRFAQSFINVVFAILWGDMCRSCFESKGKLHFRCPQETMLTSCAVAACHLCNAYVRELSCAHLGRSVPCMWPALVGVLSVHALWTILL